MRRVAGRVVLAMAAGFAAGGAGAADLEQVYRDALSYDAALASARASLEAGREKLPQGRAGLLPSLNLTGNSNWNDVNLKHYDVTRGYNNNGWQVQLTQPLFRWQNWVQYKQGEMQVALAEAQYQLARQDLTLRAAQAYFDVLVAQDVLAAAARCKRPTPSSWRWPGRASRWVRSPSPTCMKPSPAPICRRLR